MAFFCLKLYWCFLVLSNVNRINFLYYYVVCLCIISIGNFAIDIKPRAFSVWLTCHHLLFDVQRYGGLVRYQTPHFCYLQRIFSSSLLQSEIGYSWKDSLQIVGCSDFLSLPSFKHVKRQSDDGYAVTDTFHRAFNEWKDNCVYITELVMVLNHKIAQWYEKKHGASQTLR